jgi:hypothetical protein
MIAKDREQNAGTGAVNQTGYGFFVKYVPEVLNG